MKIELLKQAFLNANLSILIKFSDGLSVCVCVCVFVSSTLETLFLNYFNFFHLIEQALRSVLVKTEVRQIPDAFQIPDIGAFTQ